MRRKTGRQRQKEVFAMPGNNLGHLIPAMGFWVDIDESGFGAAGKFLCRSRWFRFRGGFKRGYLRKPRTKPVFNDSLLGRWNLSVPIEVAAALIKLRHFVGTCGKHEHGTICFGAFTIVRRVDCCVLH
jgi:hypothetical protein